MRLAGKCPSQETHQGYTQHIIGITFKGQKSVFGEEWNNYVELTLHQPIRTGKMWLACHQGVIWTRELIALANEN